MTSDSNRNFSPVTGVDSSQQARKRVRYVLPKGCIIGGSYCIEKPLGHGGMGEVYLARHMKLDIYRAIKILLPKIAVKIPCLPPALCVKPNLPFSCSTPISST